MRKGKSGLAHVMTNYLTGVRDYYGLRNVKKTVYALAFAIIGSLFFGEAFAWVQVVLFAVGMLLNRAYR
ncbi:hypothetical protein [Vibrio harveyi]|uniref:hypothetical protein n=1 Tax=Vibrio harveyi TaxID=669 RepID=UPI003BB73E70